MKMLWLFVNQLLFVRYVFNARAERPGTLRQAWRNAKAQAFYDAARYAEFHADTAKAKRFKRGLYESRGVR